MLEGRKSTDPRPKKFLFQIERLWPAALGEVQQHHHQHDADKSRNEDDTARSRSQDNLALPRILCGKTGPSLSGSLLMSCSFRRIWSVSGS
ncbi:MULTISPECIES: hypothetical protein [unclassified Mesorhizobium]|uniref:hypothetical protein n=1 Tax=unclassified Mesorhizobium TaxID=325217 RepID=UPI0015E3DADA|nr:MULTISPECIES: hypothetical protein [unclassified Mesorhizobium]MBZ9999878.1 hypothetical protein [Mesorhizobium sp. B264B2A]MCA0005672.1 hypothetical protein [Mesorhizobium sp. B264B1B]MCA0019329.1 hypothetical protein [Mesorhizobium sp. B264B1A]UCI15115.1 hypothetical protein FJ972_09775 [Mesorhizobium sp. B2-1-1]